MHGRKLDEIHTILSTSDESLDKFNQADTDGDGLVTAQELKHYLETFATKKKKSHPLGWLTGWISRMEQNIPGGELDGKLNYAGKA